MDRHVNCRCVVVTVTVEYLTHDVGHWCTRCNLTTGVRVWLVRTIGAGPGILDEQYGCLNCNDGNAIVRTGAAHPGRGEHVAD